MLDKAVQIHPEDIPESGVMVPDASPQQRPADPDELAPDGVAEKHTQAKDNHLQLQCLEAKILSEHQGKNKTSIFRLYVTIMVIDFCQTALFVVIATILPITDTSTII